MKSTEINLNIKVLTIMLEGQEVGSRGLIKINLLDEGLEATVMSLKREFALFAREKRLKDLHNSIDVHLVDVNSLHSEPRETSQGDVC
ncbi:unnamed protein product [Spirodela intermedia]|uniref:Uncharacterized protein n=2 Tax=Spirodela intermedia TaxID=51605 RepID=A0A7I8JU81_SPIIN|nr:unnamed protein product [Spirodela intermedia]CAA6673291.1 unnamed protein product [Spirodela intermedia]CAA7410514.1 unnamed protein product [Spirodela intermedia]